MSTATETPDPRTQYPWGSSATCQSCGEEINNNSGWQNTKTHDFRPEPSCWSHDTNNVSCAPGDGSAGYAMPPSPAVLCAECGAPIDTDDVDAEALLQWCETCSADEGPSVGAGRAEQLLRALKVIGDVDAGAGHVTLEEVVAFAHDFANAEPGDEEGAWEMWHEVLGGDWCEGCGPPVIGTHRDVEGVALCETCHDNLTPIPAPEREAGPGLHRVE